MQGTRPERMDLMEEIYKPIFQDVFHLLWVRPPHRQGPLSSDAATALAEDQADSLESEELEPALPWEEFQELVAASGGAGGHWAYACRRLDRPRWQSHCLPKVMDEVLKKYPSTRGLFTAHMDFWFHPFKLLGAGAPLQLDALWELAAGLPSTKEGWDTPAHFCFSDKRLLDQDNSWHWYEGLKDDAWAGAAAARQALGCSQSEPSAVCLGWADAFYLPRPWDNYTAVAAHFLDVWHEVALPTIFHTLVECTPLRNQSFPRCWGGAATGGGRVTPEERREFACGHRLDLTDDKIRMDWFQMMRDETRAAFHSPG